MKLRFLTIAAGAALAVTWLSADAIAAVAPDGAGAAPVVAADSAVQLAHGRNSGWNNHDWCDVARNTGWHRHRWNGDVRYCNPPGGGGPGWGGGGGPGWGGGGGGGGGGNRGCIGGGANRFGIWICP